MNPPPTPHAPVIGRDILYLAEVEVASIMPSAGLIADAIAAIVRESVAGGVSVQPKLQLDGPGMATFLAMTAAAHGDLTAVKWLAGNPANGSRHLPTYAGLMVLSDSVTGAPVAVLGAAQVTARRTAAMSLLAARALARPGAQTLGLIGAGAQAEAHLAALREKYPIARVLVLSRGDGAERLRDRHTGAGLDIVPAEAAELLAQSDILVSAVGADAEGFLDAARIAPGCLTIMADLGRAWLPGTMRALDRVFTDDRQASIARGGTIPQMSGVDYSGELVDILPGDGAPGWERNRTAFLFAGIALADLALGALLYRTAVATGAGRLLPV